MLTAYDYSMAKLLDAGVDSARWGLRWEWCFKETPTLPVTLRGYHTRAVVGV